jgi:hypothetical protein
MAAILRPLGNCAELLSPTAVCPMLIKCMEKAVNYVTSLEDKDLKHKVQLSYETSLTYSIKLNWSFRILVLCLTF